MARYFISYSTANESDFFADYCNMKRLAGRRPGVDKILMFIAISSVVEKTASQVKLCNAFRGLLERKRAISVESIEFKSNEGRDFSSAAFNLRRIALTADDDDYVFFLNRSAVGPFQDGWYQSYIDQLKRSDASVAGTTINFSGHKRGRRDRKNNTHVQTYAFVARFKTFKRFLDEFPGEGETDRIRLIDNGEIEMSQRIMDGGGSITCLAWPDYKFDKARPIDASLPSEDVKETVGDLPFLHRLHSTSKRQKMARLVMFWIWKIRSAI